ncbi:hypothetical protein [Pseudomonas putida]|uniref:hypothetical protein n=1 Tax=Pseudomonas putida TaxID=303 RepID=UPI00383BA400
MMFIEYIPLFGHPKSPFRPFRKRKQAACSQNFAQPDPIALAVRGLISKIETDDLLSYFFRSDAAKGLTSYGDEELGYAIQDLKDERKIGNAELVKLTIRDRPKYA